MNTCIHKKKQKNYKLICSGCNITRIGHYGDWCDCNNPPYRLQSTSKIDFELFNSLKNSQIKLKTMRKLREKLEGLRLKGFETVTIADVLNWIHQIQMDARVKRLKLDD